MLKTFSSRLLGASQRTSTATPTVTTPSPAGSGEEVSPSSTASLSSVASSSSSSPINLLRDQLRYYAVAEIKNRPYLITKNDIIVLDRLKDVQLGDVIELTQIKELGSKDYAIKGQPYVSPEYFSIKATVIEQPKGKIVETFKKKRRKHFQRRYHIKPLHTLLRVSELEVKAQ
ncbi:hypothetical protein BGZ98_010214 [Dissophora globulifera]|nr:hypothetical protein BGZ98_010214 [Dissophora globulifera]